MSALFDPELLSRLETDVKSLLQAHKALQQENEVLRQHVSALQQDYQHLMQRNQQAVQHAKAVLEQLTLSQDAPAYEANH